MKTIKKLLIDSVLLKLPQTAFKLGLSESYAIRATLVRGIAQKGSVNMELRTPQNRGYINALKTQEMNNGDNQQDSVRSFWACGRKVQYFARSRSFNEKSRLERWHTSLPSASEVPEVV